MELVVFKSSEELSFKAADIVRNVVINKPNCVLGLATGSTPCGTYKCLIDMNREGSVSFKDVTTVNLDEYYPIKPTNNQSYRFFMNDKLFDHIDIDKKNTYVLNGEAKDPDEECREFDRLIKRLGGADLQILGIGRNGHIGFNEPGDFLYPHTHKTELTESTIEANSRFFNSIDEVPRFSLTMGIGTILSAKKIIILATGRDKKDAVRRMLDDVIDTRCPATLLSLHSDVTVLVTEDVLR